MEKPNYILMVTRHDNQQAVVSSESLQDLKAFADMVGYDFTVVKIALWEVGKPSLIINKVRSLHTDKWVNFN